MGAQQISNGLTGVLRFALSVERENTQVALRLSSAYESEKAARSARSQHSTHSTNMRKHQADELVGKDVQRELTD